MEQKSKNCLESSTRNRIKNPGNQPGVAAVAASILTKTDKATAKSTSDKIITWLSEHPLISRNMLCEMVGYNASDLLKCFNGHRTIPHKYHHGFETHLRNYGYK